MAGTKAAPKMPLLPGEFKIITNSLTSDTPAPVEGERRRFRAVASSTVTDLAGNTITLRALEQMRDAFRAGLPIFMDHNNEDVVDKTFGFSDSAEIVETPVRDERTGAPIYDLIVAGGVNEPNPKAVQLHDSIVGGYVKFGASIGAIVREHKRDKETGGMLINGISVKEASIVGIAKNQRSWVYQASLAAADLPEDPNLSDDEDDEEQVVASNGEPLQQWVAKPTLTSSLDTTTTTTVVTLGDTEAEPTDAAPEAPEATETAATLDTTPGGQEADEATPETAPTTEDEADPAIEQQADSVEVEDVAALVAHVGRLVKEVGHLREENERLTAANERIQAGYDRLSTVEADATRAITQVMSLPLRRQAVGHVNDFTAAYPGLDPRVSAYIERATKDKE